MRYQVAVFLAAWAFGACGGDDADGGAGGLAAGDEAEGGAGQVGGADGGSAEGGAPAGGAPAGGAPAGGAPQGGVDPGDGPYFDFEAVIGDATVERVCTPAAANEAEQVVSGLAGAMFSFTCPGNGAWPTAGGCRVSISNFPDLPAGGFSFTQADNIDVQCQAPDPAAQGAVMASIFATTLQLEGSWDPEANVIEGTVNGSWTGRAPQGSLAGAFRVPGP